MSRLPAKKTGRLQRLQQREESLPERAILAFWKEESLYHVSRALRKSSRLHTLAQKLQAQSYSRYGHRAGRFIAKNAKKGVYHYRAGYGGASVTEAKKAGMVALCDHSIAHPKVLEYMMGHMGRFPEGALPEPTNPVERLILADIEAADHVLVNSDFVKATMLSQGWSDDQVTVVYLGVDEQFLERIPKREAAPESARLLFAGSYSKRKGAPELVEAMSRIPELPWTFEIASHIDEASGEGVREFLRDPRVTALGFLSRGDLAKKMAANDIFVFPSLVEGSARVIFEALAAGCYVITTGNSGSIVVDRVHGAVVPVGDVSALETAIRWAITNLDQVREIGKANRELVLSCYRQWHYADQVQELYRHLSA
ncbi:glycosyltransferase family 4 protein [Fimbriimonas ginsengisoli]|uniref:Glycosyltransferase n=1 Tax=Fimbriimonas ginsengisoli Gsoil 348 TaxID=661478 RepID=A0A068NV79_FIMGI|nr:glycosyltransferase family 4 protein [Fimbriimonas ginsengisoli]AIE86670.1 glycosyltransferase [Fimbriimonas ginsengisoli Gsoil 348]